MDKLYTADIVRRLGVTTETVNQWRTGSRQREPLPCTQEAWRSGHRVSFEETDVIQFLRKYRPDLLDVWTSSK